MFLLKKVFQLRDKTNPEMEKPFLDHLEDLRVMIMQVVVTLIISMILCFSLQGYLMDVLRAPVQNVWLEHTRGSLPSDITPESWEQAKDLLNRSIDLSPEQRSAFYEHFDPQVLRYLDAIRLMRAAKALNETDRLPFLEQQAADDAELKRIIEAVSATGADPDSRAGSDVMMMSALKPTETFMLSMKLAFFAGVVLAFPFLLYFILQFILPGLHQHERKILWPSMFVGFALFLTGVFFAYFFVLPKTLVFFFEWSIDMGVTNDWRIGEYITFATQFTLLFGLSFELPVVIMALVKLGLLTYDMMRRTRSYAIVAIVVAAAMITPTSDVLTLSLMAVPMYVLYEACILLAWLDQRKRRRAEKEETLQRYGLTPPSTDDEAPKTIDLPTDEPETMASDDDDDSQEKPSDPEDAR
ncbi:sec-independent protein translocase protein TatC [Haloferula luteola]|uniref:Sec-independent protein translocase protein TatC n=1 Tax=Haloferula luteola TaxID=595692 RepID=A0A840UW80_9BACT|nr:twin-arginine translocase subunit TatC [Haloferula luteola]MBB5350042.1 sec-independent protein translocase protein TatC [Haloferula luteola]